VISLTPASCVGPTDSPPRYRTAVAWGLWLALVFILYETTIPFQFRFSAAQLAAGWEQACLVPFRGPDGNLGSRADLVGNVPLFVPLGFFLALSPLLRVAGRWRPVLLCLVGGLASLVVETLQLFSPARFTQTTDLITNSAGTLLGITVARLGGRRLFERACAWALRKLTEDPSALILLGLTAAILLGALLPLDFSITRRSLAEHLQTARLDLFAPPPEGGLVAGLGLIKQAWLFAFWGAAAAFRLAGRPRPLLLVMAWAALLAVAAETSHLVIQSRSLAAITPLVTWCGAGAGAAVALWVGRLTATGRWLAVVGGLGYATYLIADCVSPLAQDVIRSLVEPLRTSGGPGKTGPIPLLPPDPVPSLMALADAAARAARFAPLGAILRLGIGSPARLAVTAAAAATVLLLELLVWRFSVWSGNLSEVGLAWAGMLAGWLAGERLARIRANRAAQEELSR